MTAAQAKRLARIEAERQTARAQPVTEIWRVIVAPDGRDVGRVLRWRAPGLDGSEDTP
ncbi:MAG: hypothetical protein ACFBWO_07680 [Paracoccaceae bacterium]